MCWSPWSEDHLFSATSDGRVISCAIESHFNDVLQPQHTSSVLALAALILLPSAPSSNPPLRAVISCAAGDLRCWVSSSQGAATESQSSKSKTASVWRQLQLHPIDNASSAACCNCSCLSSRSTGSAAGSVILGSDNGWVHSASIESLGSLRVLCSQRFHTQAVTCLDIDANGCVASGSRDGSVAVAQGLFVGDDAGICCCKGSCAGPVVAVRFCRADSTLLASCSLEASVSVWGLSTLSSSGSLLPLKVFTACVGRLTCLEWVSESADALIVGGEQQVVIEIAWRLQSASTIKSGSGASNSGAGVGGSKASKAKRQRRDDGLLQDATDAVHDTENGFEERGGALNVWSISASAAEEASTTDAPVSKSSASSSSRAADHVTVGLVPAKSDGLGLRRKSMDKSVLSRGAAATIINRPVSEAVQSLMRMHNFASGGSFPTKEPLSTPTLAEIMCDSESRVAWAGECALAAAKNPSTADAAVAVSSMSGVCLLASVRIFPRLYVVSSIARVFSLWQLLKSPSSLVFFG